MNILGSSRLNELVEVAVHTADNTRNTDTTTAARNSSRSSHHHLRLLISFTKSLIPTLAPITATLPNS